MLGTMGHERNNKKGCNAMNLSSDIRELREKEKKEKGRHNVISDYIKNMMKLVINDIKHYQ